MRVPEIFVPMEAVTLSQPDPDILNVFARARARQRRELLETIALGAIVALGVFLVGMLVTNGGDVVGIFRALARL